MVSPKWVRKVESRLVITQLDHETNHSHVFTNASAMQVVLERKAQRESQIR